MSTLALRRPVASRPSSQPAPLDEALEGAVEVVAMHFPAGELKVLETGGGRSTLSQLRGARFTTLSEDAAPEASYAETRLQGDLTSFDAYPDRYHVAVCRDVLDRLPDPQAALRRLVKAMAPGGLLMICGAIPTSFLGLLRRAGRAGAAATGPDGLKDLAAGLGLELVYEALTPSAWPQAPHLTRAYLAGMFGLRMATGGLWRPELSEMVLVFRRD